MLSALHDQQCFTLMKHQINDTDHPPGFGPDQQGKPAGRCEVLTLQRAAVLDCRPLDIRWSAGAVHGSGWVLPCPEGSR
jgi:hypothetical protein